MLKSVMVAVFTLNLCANLFVYDASARDLAGLTACISDPAPIVRESCIREGLQSKDPIARSAALTAAIENRNVIIIEIEEPAVITEANKKLRAGGDFFKVLPTELDRNSYNFFERTGGQISLEVASYDKQTNTILVITSDDERDEKEKTRHSQGSGSVSGDVVQIRFKYKISNKSASQCGFTGRAHNEIEIRGTIACSGGNPLARSTARISLY